MKSTICQGEGKDNSDDVHRQGDYLGTAGSRGCVHGRSGLFWKKGQKENKNKKIQGCPNKEIMTSMRRQRTKRNEKGRCAVQNRHGRYQNGHRGWKRSWKCNTENVSLYHLSWARIYPGKISLDHVSWARIYPDKISLEYFSWPRIYPGQISLDHPSWVRIYPGKSAWTISVGPGYISA
jgi:hypothetical protein